MTFDFRDMVRVHNLSVDGIDLTSLESGLFFSKSVNALVIYLSLQYGVLATMRFIFIVS